MRVALAFRVSDLAGTPVGVTITPNTASKGVIVMLQQGQVFKLGRDIDENLFGRIAIGSVVAARGVCNGVVSCPSGTRAKRSSGRSSEFAAREAAEPR
jgi:hypothetical protein